MKVIEKVQHGNLHHKSTLVKKVLIAVDYSFTSQKVVESGYAVAKAMNAEVILLHVFTDPSYYTSLAEYPMILFSDFSSTEYFKYVNENGMARASQYFLERYKLLLGDQSIETIAEEGSFADVILEIAEHKHVDLVVMGTHSMRWLEQVVMGSVTETVLRKAHIPLLIIPTKKVN